jgi:hypothetical protein
VAITCNIRHGIGAKYDPPDSTPRQPPKTKKAGWKYLIRKQCQIDVHPTVPQK